jgi:3-hydroxybutyryl-CoA dehydrogenase
MKASSDNRRGPEFVGRVAVVGAGRMGAQIAAEYALGGFEVRLVTRSLESAKRAVKLAELALASLAELGLSSRSKTEKAKGRLSGTASIAEACAGVEVVIESVPEDFNVKVAVLKQALQAAPPNVILATNTSCLSIGELGRHLGVEDRTLGTHYWNPPTLIPLVEVIAGPRTNPSVVKRMEELLRSIGKVPVRAPDVPGFIANRLQLALVREAVGMVRSGEASPEVIDLIMERGLGRRWSRIGPFRTMALGGPTTFATIAGLIWPRLHDDTPPGAVLEMDLPEAHATLRAARDNALARLLLEDRQGGAATSVTAPLPLHARRDGRPSSASRRTLRGPAST